MMEHRRFSFPRQLSMCGRYNLHATPQEIQAFFDLFRDDSLTWSPRYNLAPTQTVLAVRSSHGRRELARFRWGLVPFWSKDSKLAASMINARADTLAERPAFRTPFQRRRCLIPATGFYEWKAGPGKAKQPYHIHRTGQGLLAFAGLWDRWDKGPGPVESCTIITTTPNPLMQTIHDRMPVILSPDQWNIWLNHDIPIEAAQSLLQPYAQEDLTAEAVSSWVNNVRNDSVECLRKDTSAATW
jgi:putative SOS response-associated peptidase YedK